MTTTAWPTRPTTATRTTPDQRSRRAHRSGFTLLELIVVLVVLGLLAAIGIGTYVRVASSAEATSAETTVEAALRGAIAVARLDTANTAPGGGPSMVHIQTAFNETTASTSGEGAAGPYFVCDADNPSYATCLAGAANNGTGILYRADDGVVGIVVFGKPRVLGHITGNAADAWVHPDGGINDAVNHNTSGSGDSGDGLDPNHPSYRTLHVAGEATMEELHSSTTIATVDVSNLQGLALIAVMPLDVNGDPLEGGSPVGCGDVTRTILSGNANPTNCPGDPGYNPAVTGSPWGIACIDRCRIQFSADGNFAVYAFRVPTEWGGGNYDVATVAAAP